MSPENMSAICEAMVSGMLASSVAANSEVRMVPLPSATWACSGAVSVRAVKRSPSRSMVRRVK